MFEKYGIEKWFTEKVSAKDTNRPKLKEMFDFAREGDTIYIHDFSRLARSTKDLLEIVETLKAKGIHLVSNKENIDTSILAMLVSCPNRNAWFASISFVTSIRSR